MRSKSTITGMIAAALAGLASAGAFYKVGIVEIDRPFAGPPGQERAVEVVAELVGNLHNALQFRDQSRLQDALAVSVSEQRLDEVLPELHRAFAIRIQGGGVAGVDGIDNVTVRDIESLDSVGGFRMLAEWSANASAGHWGHFHQRRMRFSALMELVPVERTWKLIGLTVINVQQEKPKAS